MCFLHCHLAINLNVEFDEAEVTGFPCTEIVISVKGAALCFKKIPNPGLLFLGQSWHPEDPELTAPSGHRTP